MVKQLILSVTQKMPEVTDALIAFWNGKSSGTKSIINIAKSKIFRVKVVRI
jgi:hypothetical protein